MTNKKIMIICISSFSCSSKRIFSSYSLSFSTYDKHDYDAARPMMIMHLPPIFCFSQISLLYCTLAALFFACFLFWLSAASLCNSGVATYGHTRAFARVKVCCYNIHYFYYLLFIYSN